VEAVRAWPGGIVGHRDLLLRAWHRYGLPLALGEVHLGCTREDQLRWVLEAWRGCLDARAQGADVRAMTLWSLLGAFDWNRLVLEENGFYEPGVYDVRGPRPRETALAKVARSLSSGRAPRQPILDEEGWWRRPSRILWGPSADRGGPVSEPRGAPIAVVGATGTLGRAFARCCAARGLAVRLLSRREMDIAVRDSVEAALDGMQPWAVVNAAGYVRVDDAETDRTRCERENVVGARVVATACAARRLPLITFSSDLVFDGTKDAPYVETDAPNPLNAYGASKARAEAAVRAAHPRAMVVRTSAFFGPWDLWNFAAAVVRELAALRPFRAAVDLVVSPTYVPDLVDACLDLLVDGESGIWHLAGADAVSWADLALRTARVAGLDERLVRGVPAAELGLAARRPAHSALASERGARLTRLDDALARWESARERSDAAAVAVNDGGRTVCRGGDACPGDGWCGVHR
jgi:dTDP-4-dehydrorhamnose reductase